jgi:hypothetical protein
MKRFQEDYYADERDDAFDEDDGYRFGSFFEGCDGAGCGGCDDCFRLEERGGESEYRYSFDSYAPDAHLEAAYEERFEYYDME